MKNPYRLRYSLSKNVYVIARDPNQKKILLGGLGGMGIGQMWHDEADHHKKYPGYKKAKFIEFNLIGFF